MGDKNGYLREVRQEDLCQNSRGSLAYEAIGVTISKKIK